MKNLILRTIPLSATQTRGEEISNCITHGVGAVMSVVALVVLLIYAVESGDAWRVVSMSIYGSSLILLYAVSTLYHGFTGPVIKRVFRILDHASIYILIAGCYTPITLIAMRGPWGWTLFGLAWAIAISGIFFETFFMGRFKVITVLSYICMGSLILIAFKPMWELLPPGMHKWIFIGGGCYIFGVLFYAWKKLPYNHTIWHVCVLGGSATHFCGIFYYLI